MVNYNPNRLGARRRNRRDYSLHQRLAGKDSSDRLNERKFIKLGMQLIIISDSIRGLDNANINNDLINDEADVLLFYGLYYVMKYIHINRPCLVIPIPIYHSVNGIRFASFADNVYPIKFGFTRAEVELLALAMQLPERFQLDIGTRSQWSVNGEHAFLYFLYRFFSPSQRQVQHDVSY